MLNPIPQSTIGLYPTNLSTHFPYNLNNTDPFSFCPADDALSNNLSSKEIISIVMQKKWIDSVGQDETVSTSLSWAGRYLIQTMMNGAERVFSLLDFHFPPGSSAETVSPTEAKNQLESLRQYIASLRTQLAENEKKIHTAKEKCQNTPTPCHLPQLNTNSLSTNLAVCNANKTSLQAELTQTQRNVTQCNQIATNAYNLTRMVQEKNEIEQKLNHTLVELADVQTKKKELEGLLDIYHQGFNNLTDGI